MTPVTPSDAEVEAALAAGDAIFDQARASGKDLEVARIESVRAALTAVYALRAQTEEQIRQDERERCARIADQWREENKAASERERKDGTRSMADRLDGAATECNAIAATIRARSTVQPGDAEQNTAGSACQAVGEEGPGEGRSGPALTTPGPSEHVQPGASTEVPGSGFMSIKDAMRWAFEHQYVPLAPPSDQGREPDYIVRMSLLEDGIKAQGTVDLQRSGRMKWPPSPSPSDQGQAGVGAREMPEGQAYATHAGWREQDDGELKFEVSLVFPNKPPAGLTFDTVWKRHPLVLVEAAAIEGTGPDRVRLEPVPQNIETVRQVAAVMLKAAEDRAIAAESALAAERARVGDLRKALGNAREFIRNGIDLGFIRMPDPSTPDPAHGIFDRIDAALDAAPPQLTTGQDDPAKGS